MDLHPCSVEFQAGDEPQVGLVDPANVGGPAWAALAPDRAGSYELLPDGPLAMLLGILLDHSAQARRISPHLDSIPGVMPGEGEVDVEALFQVVDDSLIRFVRAWYGVPDRAAIERPTPHLPPTLQTWYALAASYSAPLTVQNVFIEPGRIMVRDGMSVFWLENQGVYEWAFEAGDTDPLVFERATVGGEPWHPTGVRLSAFLISVSVFEAIMGAEHQIYADSLSDSTNAALLAPLRPLPMPGPTAGTQLYGGDGLLAFTGPMDVDAPGGPARGWWLFLASLANDGLRYARAVL